MDSDTPLVSVLMTAYNREKYIAEAIQSVLASTYTNFELIIVDDGSKDSTVEIARNYEQKDKRVKVFVNDKNSGDYPNRNKAASFAIGKYIKYLDSDDIMYPHCLQVMINMMERFPNAGYGLSAIADGHKPMPICINPKEAYLEHFGSKHHFERAPGSAIIKKEAFDKTGGFSGKRMIGDYEFWLRISCYYPLVLLPRDLVWDRQHDGQEVKSDYAKKYDIMIRDITKVALNFPDCPLGSKEKSAIRAKLRMTGIKNKMRKIF